MNNCRHFGTTVYVGISYARPIRIGDVEIRATFHESIDTLRVGRHNSLKDWSHAVDIAVIHVRAMRDQDASDIRVIIRDLCSMMQSCLPADILYVWWTTVFKQQLEGRCMEKPIFTRH